MPESQAASDGRAGNQERRLQVLLDWRTRTILQGWSVPSVADIRRIAIADDAMPPGVDVASVSLWIRTLSYLLVRMRQGMYEPVEQMPDEFARPHNPDATISRGRTTSPPTPPTPPAGGNGSAPTPSSPTAGKGSRPAGGPGRGDPDTPVVAHLRAWRSENLSQHPELRDLKDSHLQGIAKAGSRTESEVRRQVPRGVAEHAGEIAELVRKHLPDSAEAETPERSGDRDRPRPSPAAGSAQPGAGPAQPDAELAGLELADADYARDEADRKIRQEIVPGADGTTLRWPEADGSGAVVLYRVVTADDDYRPQRPQDVVDEAVVTTGTTWTDTRPFTTPVRHVQVWVHSGATREAAASAEPVLHAETQVVARVQRTQVVVHGRSVVGRWEVPEGVELVRVLRVQRRKARGVGVVDREFWVNEESNLRGFVDTGARAAVEYVYLAFVKAVLNGQELYSEPEPFPITVPAEIAPVTDLEVRLRREANQPQVLDLRWTRPPHCEVRIYLSADPPTAGSAERPVPAAELERMRLTEECLLPHFATELGDGREEVRGVEWPRGSAFVWATAVTRIGDEVWVGRPHLEINLPQVTDAAIVERTHRQILVFDWPDGADNVLAFVGMPRQELGDVTRSQEPEQIPRDLYERQGGLHFRHRLPLQCTVHVMAQAYVDHRSVLGPVTELGYVGQHRLWYTLGAPSGVGRGGTPVLTLQIGAEADRRTEVPGFTLVHHQERLPLHWRDGDALEVLPAGSTQARGGRFFRPEALWQAPGQACWNVPVAGLTGWLRLFVHPEPSRTDPSQVVSYALIDPPVASLHLAPPPDGRK